jgi:hypothetical protein
MAWHGMAWRLLIGTYEKSVSVFDVQRHEASIGTFGHRILWSVSYSTGRC